MIFETITKDSKGTWISITEDDPPSNSISSFHLRPDI